MSSVVLLNSIINDNSYYTLLLCSWVCILNVCLIQINWTRKFGVSIFDYESYRLLVLLMKAMYIIEYNGSVRFLLTIKYLVNDYLDFRHG
jgi:galactitol-specific phosphotransferase system IIC component